MEPENMLISEGRGPLIQLVRNPRFLTILLGLLK